jgi:hypothetical protein
MSPVGRPSRGKKPWSSIPGMHALGSGRLFGAETLRVRRFLGDETVGGLRRGGSISFHAEAWRDLRSPVGRGTQGVPPCRRLGASGLDGPQRQGELE